MQRLLICLVGGSIICPMLASADEAAKAPELFEWWSSIIIPALGALASLGVLVFSVWTANRARLEVKASEQARIQEKLHQLEDDRRRRLTTRLSEILDASLDLLTELESQAKYQKRTGQKRDRVLTYPVIVRVIAASLEANTAERNMLQHFRELLLDSEKGHDVWVQSLAVGLGADLLVAWVHGSEAEQQAMLEAMRRTGQARSESEVRAIRREALRHAVPQKEGNAGGSQEKTS